MNVRLFLGLLCLVSASGTSCKKVVLGAAELYGKGVKTWGLIKTEPGIQGRGMEACNRDDVLIFSQLSNGQFDNGTFTCVENEVKTLDFNWQLNTSTKQLTLIYAANGYREVWVINELTDSRLEINRLGPIPDKRTYGPL
jgi:hypothetical protein